MSDSYKNQNQYSLPENQNKILNIIPLNIKKDKDNTFPQKSKDFRKSKKSVSVRKLITGNKKINININQNININSNINEIDLSLENKEKSSKPKNR